MIVLTHDQVKSLLPMADAVEVIAHAMIGVSKRDVELPLRNIMPVGGGNMMGMMPGSIGDPACFGIKLVSLFHDNPARGLSSHRGAIVLFEAETGGAVAMMDASLLTAIRTAAASAVATRALARPDATSLTIVGYGEQGEHHLDAMMTVRDITQLTVTGRNADKAAAFADRAAQAYPQLTTHHSTDVQAAVKTADIVCTVTASPTAIVMGDWIVPGTHVNIVGSSIPSMREVDDRMVLRSAIWVDYLPSTLAQAGEIVEMIKAGTFSENDLRAKSARCWTAGSAGEVQPVKLRPIARLGSRPRIWRRRIM